MNTFLVSEAADNIITILKQQLSLFRDFSDVYLFGSVLSNPNTTPQDIDILLVYPALPDTLLGTVKVIRSVLEEECRMPVDLTVLSLAEEKDVHFLDRLNSKFYRIK